MPRQRRLKSESGYYHVMIRGNERKTIFNDDEDRLRFVEILYEKKQNNRFFLQAFCLMDNHVHLMMQEGTEGIANVMKRINISYAYYFNKKYEREGHLFQDRFRSEAIEEDAYVLALVQYIHQNPVKAGIVEAAGEYRWSSYGAYFEAGHYAQKLTDTGFILGMFSENLEIAKKRMLEYSTKQSEHAFIDVQEITVMNEEDGRILWKKMKEVFLQSQDSGEVISGHMIKEFREKTNWSIRKIAAVTGINKDKINKMIKETS